MKAITERLIYVQMQLKNCSWREKNRRLRAISEKIRKAKLEYDNYVSQYDDLLNGELSQWDSENRLTLESEMQALYQQRDEKRRKIVVPADIQQWFTGVYCRGVSFGSGDKAISIVWLSKDLLFGIVSNHGGKAWAGRGQNYRYAPATHWGIRIRGKSYLEGNVLTNKVEGRLTKDAKQILIRLMEK